MRRTTQALWWLALAVVGLQALALATQYFQPWLDGDILYPQRFAEDVLDGRYPLSGWTLSSAPYLFPDFSITTLLCWLRPGAPVIPAYVAGAYLALALVAGWSLRASGRAGWGGWLAGALLVNSLLAWRGLTDHARALWWFGAPGFHGGAVLLGFAQFALWAGPVDWMISRRRHAVAAALMIPGLISDTLFLTQFLLPLGLALAVSAGRDWRSAPRVRGFAGTLLAALVGFALWRGMLAWVGWWNFSKVIRYAPTPTAIAGAVGQFFRDVAGDVGRNAGGFFLVSAVAAALALGFFRRAHREGAAWPPARRQAGWFAVLSGLSALALPMVTVYWRNAQNVRYMLPVFVLPLWWLLAVRPELPGRWRAAALGLVGASLLALGIWSGRGVRPAAWEWPYPERVAQLDEFLAREHLTHGLAHYWNAHLVNRTSHTALHLNQLRPDGRVQFWNNNAFAHFEVAGPGQTLRAPLYRFILTEYLDQAALLAKFGAPTRRVTVGAGEVWLFDDAGAARLSAQVDREVRAFLGTRPGTERIAAP